MPSFLTILLSGLFGYLPQGISYVLTIYAMSRTRLDFKKFFISSGVITFVAMFVRITGIVNFGIHILIMLVVLNMLSAFYMKIELQHSVLASLIVTLLILLIELLSYGVLSIMLTEEVIASLLENELQKTLIGIPGNCLLIGVATLLYKFRHRNLKKEGGRNGGDGEKAVDKAGQGGQRR